MNVLGFAVGCSLALVRVAHGDVAAPGEIVFDDAVVDVAGARVARKTTAKGRCDYMDTAWEHARRAWADGKPTPSSYFVDATPRRILSANEPFPRHRRSFQLTDLPRRSSKAIPGDTIAAIVEEPAGALLGLLEVDEEKHELRLLEPDGKLRWRLPVKDLWGDSASVTVDGAQLVVANFSRFSTGSRLLAVDPKSGALGWRADVEQLNVAHSEYYNDVTVEKRGDAIVMRGTEAGGCYLQIFDHATGRRRLSLKNRLW